MFSLLQGAREDKTVCTCRECSFLRFYAPRLFLASVSTSDAPFSICESAEFAEQAWYLGKLSYFRFSAFLKRQKNRMRTLNHDTTSLVQLLLGSYQRHCSQTTVWYIIRNIYGASINTLFRPLFPSFFNTFNCIIYSMPACSWVWQSSVKTLHIETHLILYKHCFWRFHCFCKTVKPILKALFPAQVVVWNDHKACSRPSLAFSNCE